MGFGTPSQEDRGIEEDKDGERLWRRNTFYPVLNQIISSLNSRFNQNASIFSALSMFSPKCFASIIKGYHNSEHLVDLISAFCNSYGVEPAECAKELFSFAATFKKLKKTSTDIFGKFSGKCNL